MPTLRPSAKSRIYSSLGKYARSGMGMDKACDSLLAQPGISSAERDIYLGLQEGIRSGESIGSSLGRGGLSVGGLEREVVSAAEAGGMLDKGFAHLAEYFRRVATTRRRILKGLAYPLVVLHLALPVTVFATAMFSRFRFDGQGPSFGESFARAGMWALQGYLLAALILGGMFWLSRLARRSPAADRLLGRVPFWGKARRFEAMERFCRVFEIFLLAGGKMSGALDGAGRASGSGAVAAAASHGARTIEEGGTLSEALFAHPGAFPNDFARGTAAAEEAGALDEEMRRWGDFYAESAAEAMESLAEWTPRIFYWLTLAIMAFLIIRVGLAYRDLILRLL